MFAKRRAFAFLFVFEVDKYLAAVAGVFGNSGRPPECPAGV
jgi:hypothetical protein